MNIFEYMLQGSVAGFFAIVVYIITKNWNEKTLKKDLAVMMLTEISHNKEILHVMYVSNENMQFITKAYAGMMHSTNIRYFGADLQKYLQTLDMKLQKKFGKLTAKDLDNAIKLLEKMRDENKHILLDKCKSIYNEIKQWITIKLTPYYLRLKINSEQKTQKSTPMSGMIKR